jgi:hypothetical protein
VGLVAGIHEEAKGDGLEVPMDEETRQGQTEINQGALI